MRIETDHEIVGKFLWQIKGLDIGSLYPVVGNDGVVVGVFSSEFGTPSGYRLDEKTQAFWKITDYCDELNALTAHLN